MGEPTDRMLGAVVPRGGQTWYFKMNGEKDLVADQREAFLKFVNSITFADENGPPHWKLPEGWKQSAGVGMRFATLVLPVGNPPLEVTVIPLPSSGENPQADLLANVNRWRGQMGLGNIEQVDLYKAEEFSETLEVDLVGGGKATLVNLLGRSGGGMMPPFAGGKGTPPFAGGKGTPKLPDNHPPVGATSPLSYTTPKGWNEGKAGGFRKATFDVTEGGKKLEITVIDLSANSGSLLDNVNRWREQIQLPKIDQATLEQTTTSLTIDGQDAHYVKLLGPETATPREALLGAILTRGPTAWYFKLKGDLELAQREEANFQTFLKSVKFN